MRPSILLFAVGTMWAQDGLTLRDAVQMGLRKNPAIAAAGAGVRAADERIAQARGGRLPKVNYAESWMRGNNPVYVFSSLLTQHQFTMDNFQIGPLNRPDAMNNFQSQVTIDQPVYDAGQTRTAVRSAELGRGMTTEEERKARMQVIVGAARAYYGVVLAEQSLRTAQEAVKSAQADLDRARTIRAAGMSTDADVLSVQVHLANVDEQRIRRAADLDVARAALNDALGLPLETAHTLTTPLTAAEFPEAELAQLESTAVAQRPEAQQLALAADLVRTQAAAARSAMLPQVSIRAALEADRQRFYNRGGANWLTAVSLRWNLFNGFGDRSRIAEASHALAGAQANRDRVASAIRLEVRRAWAELRAAEQRIEVAKAAVEMAQESLRITQNRYSAGLTNVTELLRNETALLETRTRYLAAIHDQRVAAVMLDLAAGVLSSDSKSIL